jgi:hypothetical protein
MINPLEIKKLTKEIGKIFDFQIIFTGSIADYFNIGYTNIKDIDIVIGDLNAKASEIDSLKILKINKKLKHKHSKDLLYRCEYGEYGLDIWIVKNFDLSTTNKLTINIDNIDYTIFAYDHQTRYSQLTNAVYFLKDQNLLKIKKKKLQDRIVLYKQYFDSLPS